jgi:hypothetical protein
MYRLLSRCLRYNDRVTFLQKTCLILALLLAVNVSFADDNAPAQESPQLSSQQRDTIRQLKTQLNRMRTIPHYNASERQAMLNALDESDPVLVGRHVVFGKNWLDHVGTGKPLTKKQFADWRDNVDKIYDAYVELIGRTPASGTKVFIDAPQGESAFTNETAHAHTGMGIICFKNTTIVQISRRVATGSWDIIMAHELAHIFAGGRGWNVDAESIAYFLPQYVPETITGANYNGATGSQDRKRRYDRALRNYRAGRIASFAAGHESSDSAFELYLHGLVDKVGWETFKKVFRSYDDRSYVPKRYEVAVNDALGRKTAQARNFLDRIEHFSEEADVLRSLPDKGELLDKYFLPSVVPPVSSFAEAARRGTVDDVRNFINRGERINRTGNPIWTPLSNAVRYNSDVEVVKFLLSQGANVNQKVENRTPLDIARTDNLRTILRESGGKTSAELTAAASPPQVTPPSQVTPPPRVLRRR